MKKSVVTFGEIMMRLSTPGYQRFVQAQSFDINFGGGEANVAVSLAQFNLPSKYVTRLPYNELGDMALNSLRKFGVNTEGIVRGGERIGMYFLETGASQRSSKIIYDRKSSSIAEVTPGMIQWDEIFSDAQWFHVTGITPALSESLAETTIDAARKAHEQNITVSCDINYRKKLWSVDAASKALSRLLEHVDVLIANEEHVQMLFNIAPEKNYGNDEIGKTKSLSEQLKKQFPTLQKVAMTYRSGSTATDNIFYALLWNEKEILSSKHYEIRIVDRVGGGDSFGAGLIYGLVSGKTDQDALEFAVAAACIKHTVPGDFNYCTAEEVEELIKSGSGGRVQR